MPSGRCRLAMLTTEIALGSDAMDVARKELSSGWAMTYRNPEPSMA